MLIKCHNKINWLKVDKESDTNMIIVDRMIVCYALITSLITFPEVPYGPETLHS